MKKHITTFLITIFFISLGIIAWNGSMMHQSKPVEENNIIKDSLIKRGKYLVDIMGCHDCHSPKIMTAEGPVPDPARLLSGHPSKEPLPKFDNSYTQSWAMFTLGGTAIVGPWGVSYAANITSDATGIGNWTESQFFKAMREGKFKGLDNTRRILPPMPWPAYAKATNEDLHAIFTYLKSTKPVKNVAPEPAPPSATRN